MPRILVVEDYSDTREMYATFLELNGMEVLQAADGLTALGQLAAGRPDVVILDVSLPQIDGIEVLRRIRGDSNTCHLPVIVVSAGPVESFASKSVAAGATLALSKPLLPDELLAAIVRVLGASPTVPPIPAAG